LVRRALGGWERDRSDFGRIEMTEVALVHQPPAAVGLEACVTQPLANLRKTYRPFILA
jgi:hypothetical protein